MSTTGAPRPAVSTDKDSARATGTMNACDTDALSAMNKTASNHTSSRPRSGLESRGLSQRRPQLRESGADRFRRYGGEVRRQELAAGALERRDETLVLELQRIRRRLEVPDELAQQRGAQRRPARRRHAPAAAHQDRFEVGRRQRVAALSEQRRGIDPGLELDAQPRP